VEVSATLKRASISPQKARLVADQIRGKSVNEALLLLEYSKKKAAFMIRKLLMSAVANAEDRIDEFEEFVDVDDLKVAKIYVNEGSVLKRIRPRAKGRADRILKRSSHLTVTVSEI